MAEFAGKIRAETGIRLLDAIIAASGLLIGASHVITEDKLFEKASRYIASIAPDEFIKMHG